IENPYEFLYRLWPALAPGARVGIIDTEEPTQRHGTPPALLRCELAAVGYRELDFVPLTPADGYLAVFSPPESLPAPETINACSPWPGPFTSAARATGRVASGGGVRSGGVGPPRPARSPQGCDSGEWVTQPERTPPPDDRTRPPRAPQVGGQPAA